MAEVELKLEVKARDVEGVRRAPLLRGVRSRRLRLDAVYLDTPDEALRAHGMGLRLRREGGRWVQTLKAGGSVDGGLHDRQEWEYASRDGSVDLARFAGTPLARLPGAKKLHESLEAAFEVEVERTVWMLTPARGVRVEVALDLGHVRHAGRDDVVSELEIESKAGPAAAVFEIAEALLETIPMHPSVVSKAQRGYRLRQGGLPAPARSIPVVLDTGLTPHAAACAVARAALAQVQANDEGALASDDPEYVHQLRVGLRRLRSALRVFRKPFAATLDAGVKETLRWVTGIAGHARDLDVLDLHTVPQLVSKGADAASAEALKKRLERARGAARSQLREALESARYARCILVLARALRAPPRDKRQADLRRFACKRLDKLLDAFVARSEDIEHLDDRARHQVRIRAKRLRYGLDALGSLFKGKEVKRYAALLSAVQDDLGEANDAVVAQRLLAELDEASPFTQFARGALQAHAEAAASDLAARVRLLRAARPPWRNA